jgi:hypothetical protein
MQVPFITTIIALLAIGTLAAPEKRDTLERREMIARACPAHCMIFCPDCCVNINCPDLCCVRAVDLADTKKSMLMFSSEIRKKT